MSNSAQASTNQQQVKVKTTAQRKRATRHKQKQRESKRTTAALTKDLQELGNEVNQSYQSVMSESGATAAQTQKLSVETQAKLDDLILTSHSKIIAQSLNKLKQAKTPQDRLISMKTMHDSLKQLKTLLDETALSISKYSIGKAAIKDLEPVLDFFASKEIVDEQVKFARGILLTTATEINFTTLATLTALGIDDGAQNIVTAYLPQKIDVFNSHIKTKYLLYKYNKTKKNKRDFLDSLRTRAYHTQTDKQTWVVTELEKYQFKVTQALIDYVLMLPSHKQ